MGHSNLRRGWCISNINKHKQKVHFRCYAYHRAIIQKQRNAIKTNIQITDTVYSYNNTCMYNSQFTMVTGDAFQWRPVNQSNVDERLSDPWPPRIVYSE